MVIKMYHFQVYGHVTASHDGIDQLYFGGKYFEYIL